MFTRLDEKSTEKMTAATIESQQERIAVPKNFVVELYRKMLTVYYVEERMKAFAKQGKCSFVASTRGHEMTQIGITLLLKPGHDWFFTYYRSKATAIGLGIPLKDIFLGMLGRQGDPNSGGRNMPEHFSSPELNYVAQTACTGSQYLPAVGMAKAVKLDGGDRIVYVESGEGATSEGEFFESLNWASREKLPILFCVQNNGYAISVPQNVQTASSVHRIAEGFGLTTFEIDGGSIESIFDILPPAIDFVRRGGGPVLIEAKVERLDPHSSSDDHRKYRSEEELAGVAQRDPVLRAERYLLEREILSASEMENMRDEIQGEVSRAADWTDAQPEPSAAALMANIYADKQIRRGEFSA